MLYDLYQELLTDRQKQFTELYFQDDLSFAEIAEEFAISRQGVYEHIKRTEKLLDEYEDKLGLLEKTLKQHSLIDELEQEVEQFIGTDTTKLKTLIKGLKKID